MPIVESTAAAMDFDSARVQVSWVVALFLACSGVGSAAGRPPADMVPAIGDVARLISAGDRHRKLSHHKLHQDQALAAYRQALRIAPDIAVARHRLAMALLLAKPGGPAAEAENMAELIRVWLPVVERRRASSLMLSHAYYRLARVCTSSELAVHYLDLAAAQSDRALRSMERRKKRKLEVSKRSEAWVYFLRGLLALHRLELGDDAEVPLAIDSLSLALRLQPNSSSYATTLREACRRSRGIRWIRTQDVPSCLSR